jgi:hypothetical protein
MRNRIVHGYDHVDLDIVWRVATDDLQPVLAALERVRLGSEGRAALQRLRAEGTVRHPAAGGAP